MSPHDELPVDLPDPPIDPPTRHGRRSSDHVQHATAERERTTRSQRRINFIWEITQAFVTVSITIAEVYAQLHGIHSEMLNAAFFGVISTYLARTNHTKIGGVPANYTGR